MYCPNFYEEKLVAKEDGFLKYTYEVKLSAVYENLTLGEVKEKLNSKEFSLSTCEIGKILLKWKRRQ